jgi:predicted dehydrogenase
VTAPLRIGILGTARIADEGIVDPARTLGHEVVAVAARDRARAEAFAAERSIAIVHDTYADLIADPDIDLVYNGDCVWDMDAGERALTASAAGDRVSSDVGDGSRTR